MLNKLLNWPGNSNSAAIGGAYDDIEPPPSTGTVKLELLVASITLIFETPALNGSFSMIFLKCGFVLSMIPSF